MVAKKVGSLCKEKGISCATVQCTLDEATSKARAMRPDVIIGSLESMKDFDVPVLAWDGSESDDNLQELLSVLSK